MAHRIDITDTTAVRDFITRSDAIGAPGDPEVSAFWEQVSFHVPPWVWARCASMHPLSREYFEMQDQLYRFLVGGLYSEASSEFTAFDREAAENGRLAYPGRPPHELNKYLHAHARMVDHIDSKDACDILEVGSGWGFSAEYLARLGHRVTGIDINPDFVDVSSRRSRRQNLGIDYRLGTFESLPLKNGESFDVIYCFEAFHHARDPLGTLQRFRKLLRPDGQFILFGEPFIPPSMWPTWGLRTDPLSVYCTAKFGWWESGWTREFMSNAFRTVGLVASFTDDGSDLQRYLVGRIGTDFGADQLTFDPAADGWERDRHYLMSKGDARLEFHRPLKRVRLGLSLFCPTAIWVRFESPALTAPFETRIMPGENEIEIPFDSRVGEQPWQMRIVSQRWNPARVLGTSHDIELSFHLHRVTEEPEDA